MSTLESIAEHLRAARQTARAAAETQLVQCIEELEGIRDRARPEIEWPMLLGHFVHRLVGHLSSIGCAALPNLLEPQLDLLVIDGDLDAYRPFLDRVERTLASVPRGSELLQGVQYQVVRGCRDVLSRELRAQRARLDMLQLQTEATARVALRGGAQPVTSHIHVREALRLVDLTGARLTGVEQTLQTAHLQTFGEVSLAEDDVPALVVWYADDVADSF